MSMQRERKESNFKERLMQGESTLEIAGFGKKLETIGLKEEDI